MPIIGREWPADIVIPAPQVSARHAEIRDLGEERFLLVDLGSTNGTFVNEQRIASCVITFQDSLRFGSLRVDLRPYRHLIPQQPASADPAPAGHAEPRSDTGVRSATAWGIAFVILSILLLLTGILLTFGPGHDTAGFRGAPSRPSKPESRPADESAEGEARTIATALEAYSVDSGFYPETSSMSELERLIVPRYIAAIPIHPRLGAYRVTSTREGYEIRSGDGRLINKNGVTVNRGEAP